MTDELKNRQSYDRMVGESKPMREVYHMIERVKDIDTNILITGESGTGKELVARAIHDLGRRAKNRFVVVNCAAIPEDLLETEFFGYRKGAFTGALQDRKGKFEVADKGTIFLDEIGDMPLNLQAKLLRMLESKEVTPLGGNDTRYVDVRVIAATNRDLRQMGAQGTFREDLYYRLNVLQITVPALCQRKSDIPLLSSHFVQQFSKEQGKNITAISPDAQRCLVDNTFPGNVRQLANVMEYAVILCTGTTIELGDLPKDIRAKPSVDFFEEETAPVSLREMEKRTIKAALARNHGRRDITAQELGISTRGLLNKIREYSLE